MTVCKVDNRDDRRLNEPEGLEALCNEICDKMNATYIFDRLCRAGIDSISYLKMYNLKEISCLKGLGPLRLEYIKEMKLSIGDTNI